MNQIIPMKLLLLIATFAHANQGKIHNELYRDCGVDEKSQVLAQLLIDSSEQKRSALHCNIKLTQAAQKKAQMMSETEYISHNLFHTTPNELLRNEQVLLPNYYKTMGNQVETILGGAETAKDALLFFQEDPEYRVHIFGGNDITLEQDQIGIGYYEDKDKRHRYYWAVYISALGNEDEKHNVKLEINPSIISHNSIKHASPEKEKVQFPNQLLYKSELSSKKERLRREENNDEN